MGIISVATENLNQKSAYANKMRRLIEIDDDLSEVFENYICLTRESIYDYPCMDYKTGELLGYNAEDFEDDDNNIDVKGIFNAIDADSLSADDLVTGPKFTQLWEGKAITRQYVDGIIGKTDLLCAYIQMSGKVYDTTPERKFDPTNIIDHCCSHKIIASETDYAYFLTVVFENSSKDNYIAKIPHTYFQTKLEFMQVVAQLVPEVFHTSIYEGKV